MKPSHIRRWLVALCLAFTLAPQLSEAGAAYASGRTGAIQPEKFPDECRDQRHVCQCR